MGLGDLLLKFGVRLTAIALSATLPVALLLPAPAIAQPYPSKPIRMIVPNPAGSASDVMARVVSQKMAESLGQPIFIDNRPGTSVGVDLAAKAPADGYNLVMGTNSSFALNVSIYAKLNYDPLKDFVPVTLVARLPYLVLTNPAFPANTMAELIALARAQPGKLDVAGGVSTAQLAVELINSLANIKLTHIPYKGTPQALNDVLGGQLPLLIADTAVALPHIKSGKLKVLGITSAKRSDLLPDVPTIAEAGLAGYELVAWWCLMAPTGTSKEAVTRLNKEIVKVLRMPEVKQQLLGIGIETIGTTPEELGAYILSEIPKWARVAKLAGIKPE